MERILSLRFGRGLGYGLQNIGQGCRKILRSVHSIVESLESSDGSHPHPAESGSQGSGYKLGGGADQNVSSPQLPASTEASTSRPSKRLKSTTTGAAYLTEILEFLQKVVDRYKHRFDPKILPSKFTSEMIDEGNGLLDRISNAFNEKATHGGLRTTLSESKTLIKDVLEGVGKLPALAGLEILAYAASRVQDCVERMGKNEEDIFNILEQLGILGRSLLRANLSDEDKELQDDLIRMFVGVIWCEQHLQFGPLRRFATVNITAEYIEDLIKRVKELRGNLHLAVCTEGLQTVRSLRDLTATPLEDYKAPFPAHAVGLCKPVDEVLELLGVRQGTAEGGVKAILLHGIGGIGKTTLATAVCSKIPTAARHFAKVELGENPRICKLQMKLFERLSGKLRRIGEFQEGQMLLEEHFASQQDIPFLLFIDNVFDPKDLSMLLPDTLDTLPDGSRVILTSRSRQAIDGLDKISKIIYSLGMLDPADARELFDKCIKSSPDEKDEEIKCIVSLCGGLPLALELVGSYLRNTSEKGCVRVWTKVRNDLEKCNFYAGGKEDKLDKILSWSYENLSQGAQRLFLDICAFPLESWEAVQCLDLGLGTDLQELEDSSLVKKVASGDAIDTPLFGYRGVVHDVLTLFGRNKSLPNARALRQDWKSLETFLLDGCENHHSTEGLLLDRWIDGVSLPLSAATLDAMHNSLRILLLTSAVRIQGTCKETPSNLAICSMIGRSEGLVFPYSDISDFQQLRLLTLHNCRVPGIKDIQLPGNLEVCTFAELEELQVFRTDAFAKCSSSLHILVIFKCKNLVALPHYLSCAAGADKSVVLRKLVLFGCDSLKALPDCMSGLQSLECLIIYRCPQVKELLIDLGNRPALLLLRIAHCGSVEKFPKSFENLGSLKYLDVEYLASLVQLPDYFGNLSALAKLSLRGCSKLGKLPCDFGNLLSLKELVLEDCQGLDTLPEA